MSHTSGRTFASSAARSRRGGTLLLAALLAGCSHQGPRTTDAPTPTTPARAPQVVTAADIRQSPNEPIEQQLMARTPGVVIGRTSDGSLTIRIRGGASSLRGNNAPLYIVDGVPFSPSTDGGLSGLNPHDISSIRVLKDAADITMYGIRGANGVIVIKTKHARQ
ncbi:MAG TPA: TonB-dependent receptor plug domain-containing protein [Gemmatimonadaceae bacterium]|nr:TonB-dependent receptor plug domain-containing protein [Gemmatimonadaceae bacterium]